MSSIWLLTFLKNHIKSSQEICSHLHKMQLSMTKLEIVNPQCFFTTLKARKKIQNQSQMPQQILPRSASSLIQHFRVRKAQMRVVRTLLNAKSVDKFSPLDRQSNTTSWNSQEESIVMFHLRREDHLCLRMKGRKDAKKQRDYHDWGWKWRNNSYIQHWLTPQ